MATGWAPVVVSEVAEVPAVGWGAAPPPPHAARTVTKTSAARVNNLRFLISSLPSFLGKFGPVYAHLAELSNLEGAPALGAAGRSKRTDDSVRAFSALALCLSASSQPPRCLFLGSVPTLASVGQSDHHGGTVMRALYAILACPVLALGACAGTSSSTSGATTGGLTATSQSASAAATALDTGYAINSLVGCPSILACRCLHVKQGFTLLPGCGE